MYKELDISNWNRKEHFEFFKEFEEPFYGVTVKIDCTDAYLYCKQHNISFFLFYLHRSLCAANAIEPFRYRMKDDRVLVFDQINCAATILRPDETFGFSYMDYHEDFSEFEKTATLEIEKVKNSTGLVPASSGANVIHYSSLPWLNFTGLSHARSFSFPDSCPKISFGKLHEENGRKLMPVSIHVHHALMDGYHVGQFTDTFQSMMNDCAG
ncbi:chloramphenicol acetyltransferase [Aliamphritea spongicola]|uniref:chloramphenicol acetyltransferase n=1 Tax=Aliamphritea spongicola TaxID=707589 RepID=UPI00196A2AE1|nr:chloramphenicol acetyltransferase [Aliamphritea spongicola]MBN3562934.1 chloramphenicol acetyltransferase [Aliamphritea spongicola]